jgi:hypothetical protein
MFKNSKIVFVLVCVTCILLAVCAGCGSNNQGTSQNQTSDQNQITMYGKPLSLSSQPVFTATDVMVPYTVLQDNFQANVQYSEADNTISADFGDAMVKLVVGQNTAMVYDVLQPQFTDKALTYVR